MELNFFILCAFTFMQAVSAFPTKGTPYKAEHCIKMTPDKEKEINAIVARLTDFLDNIATEFENYDIRLVKLDIERHSDDEIEEKDVQLKLTVNDCIEYEEGSDSGETNDDSKETDIPTEASDLSNATRTANTNPRFENHEKCSCASENDKTKDGTILNKDSSSAPPEIIWFIDLGRDNNDVTNGEIQFFNRNNEVTDWKEDNTDVESNKEQGKPELMPLDLTEAGEDVWQIFERRNKKPLLVYVQRKSDGDEYVFL